MATEGSTRDPGAIPANSVWDDTDIVHVVEERGFTTGTDEEIGALIAWMRANSLIDTSTGEIVWADEARADGAGQLRQIAGSLRERGLIDTSTGEILWVRGGHPGGPGGESLMLNNKNPELTRYVGETEKNLLDDGPSTLLGGHGAQAAEASGDVDGADFLVWQRGVADHSAVAMKSGSDNVTLENWAADDAADGDGADPVSDLDIDI